MHIVAIQHAADTDRYHPAYYSPRPLPGPLDGDAPERYESRAHHTAGFDALGEAKGAADALALSVGAARPADGWPLRELPEAGPDIWLMASTGALA